VSGTKFPDKCLICDQKVSRFWGVGATYLPHGSETGELASDVSVVGFCRLHREDVIPAALAVIQQKGEILRLLEPAVELRTGDLESFMAFVASFATAASD